MTVPSRWNRGVRLAVVGVLAVAGLGAAAPASHAVDVPPYPGSLPDSSSAVTATGRGPLSNFAVHVNQTTNLTSQGISLSWSWAGKQTITGNLLDFDIPGATGTAGLIGNYVQVMQCWGDAVEQSDVDAATGDAVPVVKANFVAANPGPAREHCQYGGSAQTPGVPNLISAIQMSRSADSAVAAGSDAEHYGDETAYPAAPATYTNYPEVPFVSVDGVTTRNSFTRSDTGGLAWSNNYFGNATTNEIYGGRVNADGTGGATFQAQNSLDAPGLGCGATDAAGTGLNKCWLVVVPRPALTTLGSDDELKQGATVLKPTKKNQSGKTVFTGPLASTLWANRIAIPLTFQPTLDACANASANYQTVGSALPQNALLSWQAALCQSGGGSRGYTYTYTPDSIARQELSSGSKSMRLLSTPVPTDQAFDPVTYAPLTISGMTVSYVFEPASTNGPKFSEPTVSIKLDQRLVAKALTQSYQQANYNRLNTVAQGTPAPSEYAWLAGNPATIWQDPEFWELNPDIVAKYPELKDGSSYIPGIGSNGYLQVNGLGSDGYTAVWKWLLADGDTRAFLAGEKDTWGMSVDPYYSTNAAINPSGAAFDPSTLDYFPSLDQWQGDPGGSFHSCAAGTVTGDPRVGTVDIAPFAQSFQAVARDIVRVDPLNKAVIYNCPDGKGGGLYNADAPPGWLSGYSITFPGQRKMLGLTDTASSEQYGVVTASLRNADGKFVAPTTASMQAAASHLTYTGGVQGVGQPDQSNKDAAAYPLTMISYAAVQTNEMDDATCAAYSDLLTYAAGQGQTSGADVGQLPLGYAPLSTTLKTQTKAAAATVAQCAKVKTEEPPAEQAPPAADPVVAPNADATSPDVPTDSAPAAAANAPVTQPPTVSLAARGTTKPDPSVFAWVVPIALLLGLAALLFGPLAGLRRRRTDQPPGGAG